ncbi:bifunctional [glutamine synthetase] adenylyltransferase/[glutamine synthetase]-adenylyl-L-tyrosine phosphorylase [Sphingomonas japonica]|uniref:Glutamate-ammonia-ligase adenylyltransferase n=1 Tax=Sphingomonas japonica TaxID=511662 RepID=A0ABX0TWV0_9SPHN|nr:bifunctional [glutamine synthetase] adenylyltransferase/[glutamine synthetase]-adenylyl-L-tyrosine phosphorylase [Sphingomonas japonica]NIJ22801.1 glutamate-ammonia-ligase adenylyltransferase [Sphingomonas japonica]
MVTTAAIFDAMARAQRHSDFLGMAARRFPDLLDDPLALLADPIAAAFAGTQDFAEGKALRLARRRLAWLVAIGDLSGSYDFRRVTAILTRFADMALDRAIRTAMLERTPDAEPGGFAAIALGKQGSFELNYSSDIDPVLIFDPQTLPCRPREAADEAAVRIGKRVVDLLQTRDGDGYVLRVDLRLRPSPEATPIALPVDAAIGYYESQALPWERAAYIRARAAAGDIALGQRFLDAIRPFIWRRSLDFGAIGELREITSRIRDHYAQGQAFGPGYDLKRGRGGIREVEFFTQVHQLIHGGRDPELRAPATLDALERLSEAGWVEPETARALGDAYVALRTAEHRVQMIDDRQTHCLPEDQAALDRVAALDGVGDGAALLAWLRPHVDCVGRLYDAIEPEASDRLPGDDAALLARLEAIGFDDDPESAAQRIAVWRQARYPALRSAAAQAALEAVLPGLMAALGGAPQPAAAIVRLDAMLARLPSAINFFRLIEAEPGLARLLSAILSHAPTLAEQLGRRADLLDGLIDASAFDAVGTVEQLAADMARGEAGADYQALLDHVRRVVNERRFALGAQIVAGAADPLDVARGYARVAEAAVEVLARATVTEFARAHGKLPDGELVILALGRLGGGALTHASDLDLIYCFSGDYAAESDGARPLGAVHYYNRLAQRVTAALSVATASGPLYDVDTRLRPSGTQGPLAVSLDGFAQYQREQAWTWEHMALTRARPVFGSPSARAQAGAIIAAVLEGDRPQRDVRSEAAAMRDEMAAHKPPTGPLDAKLSPGGLVDLEFAVHTVQLIARTGFNPRLDRAIAALAAHGLLPQEFVAAHDFLTRLLVTLRLVAPDAGEPPESTRLLVARALSLPDWPAVVATFAATRQEVLATWQKISKGAPQ